MELTVLLLTATLSQFNAPTVAVEETLPLGGEALPLVDESLDIQLDGQHATTTLEQIFHNSTSRALEGIYELQVPSGTEVEGFSYWNGEQRITGEVFEKSVARSIYESVRTRRRDPGLLERIDEGLFRFRVFPIAPGERKRVQVRYSRWLPAQNGRVEYRGPTALPRAHIVFTTSGLAAFPVVSSKTHNLDIKHREGANNARITATPNGRRSEVVVQWEERTSEFRLGARAHTSDDTTGYLNLVLGASQHSPGARVGRDITLMIDRSGSMAGAPLRRAKETALAIVDRMTEADRVNVGFFDDHADLLFARPQGLGRKTMQSLRDHIERVRSGGGTNIAGALQLSLQAQAVDSRPNFLLLITDGRSDSAKAFQAVKKSASKTRLFTVGLGEQVSKPMLTRLASISGGRFVYVDRTEALEEQAVRLLGQTMPPVWEDTIVEVNGIPLHSAYPRRLPDLSPGAELRVSGRFAPADELVITVRGKLAGKKTELRQVIPTSRTDPHPWVGKLWARSRVDELMQEEAQHGAAAERTEELVNLAVAYNFVTPHTAFLAIPANEAVGAARLSLKSARERKKRLLERHPDAAQILHAESQTGHALRKTAKLKGALGAMGGTAAGAGGVAGLGTMGRVGGKGLSYGGGGTREKAQKQVSVSNRASSVTGALPPDVIKKVVQRNRAQIRYCYEVQLQRAPSLEGRVVIRWVIASNGSVAKAEIKDSTLNSATVEQCMLSKIRRWKFPEPLGGGVVDVRYPFVFRARQ